MAALHPSVPDPAAVRKMLAIRRRRDDVMQTFKAHGVTDDERRCVSDHVRHTVIPQLNDANNFNYEGGKVVIAAESYLDMFAVIIDEHGLVLGHMMQDLLRVYVDDAYTVEVSMRNIQCGLKFSFRLVEADSLK